jgi:dolichyl-phosphate-mannose-protein mannosyltransferase
MLDRLKALRDRPILVALLIGAVAQALFMVHLDRPYTIVFDEFHYVPAAQSLIDLGTPRNAEHPLLAKEFIALGLALFGDNPWGWRIFPSLAGSATVVAGFAFLWLLLGNLRAAVTGAALMMLNQSLFVQARTAMLDVFLGAFVMWALVALLWSARAPPGKAWGRWILGSVLLGLAVAVKWAAIPYAALAGLAFVVLRVRDHWPARRLAPVLSGKDQPHWAGIGTIPGLAVMAAVSIPVYLVTFLPYFFFEHGTLTIGGLLPLQLDMYASQTQVLQHHRYQSDWWSWPLMIRPIWYFYAWDSGAQRGVLLIGHPLIMWGGLVAVLAGYWAWLRERAFAPLAMALLWTASVAIYAVIPKSLGFYYYYHLSALFLCLALPVAFHHFDRGRDRGWGDWYVAACVLMFAYFYPILAASPLKDDQAFLHWTWFESWK